PHVGLAGVQMKRLDHARLRLAVIDLADGDAAEAARAAAVQTEQLGDRAAIVDVTGQLDDLDAVDPRPRLVRLQLKPPLRLRAPLHCFTHSRRLAENLAGRSKRARS